MESPFSITDIVYGFVVPMVTTMVMLFVLRRFVLTCCQRYAAPLAIACGFLGGYGLLALGPWTPAFHWHWIPYSVIAAALIGPIASADGVHPLERPLLYSIVAIAAFWMLVPTWEDLDPSRQIYLILTVVGVIVLASALEVLAERLTGPIMPALLFATMTAGSVVLALSESLRFAQIAIAGSGALLAVAILSLFDREQNLLAGGSLLFAVLVIGTMLVGQVNSFSEVPAASYAVLPFAPLLGWLGTIGPLSKLTGAKRFAAVLIPPLVLIGIAVGMAALASLPGGDGY